MRVHLGVYEYKRTGDKYRVTGESFDVKTQKPHVIYLALASGAVFNRDCDDFAKEFTFRGDIQGQIVPKKAGDINGG